MERKRALANREEEEEAIKRQKLAEIRQHVHGFELDDLDGEVEEGDRASVQEQAETVAMINVSICLHR
jgi:hypothetical protein